MVVIVVITIENKRAMDLFLGLFILKWDESLWQCLNGLFFLSCFFGFILLFYAAMLKFIVLFDDFLMNDSILAHHVDNNFNWIGFHSVYFDKFGWCVRPMLTISKMSYLYALWAILLIFGNNHALYIIIFLILLARIQLFFKTDSSNSN